MTQSLNRRALLAGVVAIALVAALVAVAALQRGSNDDLVETILTSSDSEEVAAAVDELVRRPDPEAIRRLADASGSDPSAASHLRTIRDGLINRLGGTPAEPIPILEALAIIDDDPSAQALVDALLLAPDPEIRAAAARLLPGLDQGLTSAIGYLIDARSADSGPAAEIEDVLRAIGNPAIDAVAAVGLNEVWTLGFLASVDEAGLVFDELISNGRLSDLRKATNALVGLEKTDPKMAEALWPPVLDGLRNLITPNPRRDQQIAEILQDVERVRPDLARPIQEKIVDVLLPKLGGTCSPATSGCLPNFAVSDALARVGRAAVPELIEIARQEELSSPKRRPPAPTMPGSR